MDYQLLITPNYWQTIIGSAVSILTMCVMVSWCIMAFINYGKKAIWMPILGGTYFFLAILYPLPGLDALIDRRVLELGELIRTGVMCIILFGLLYFEAFYDKGQAKITEAFLHIAYPKVVCSQLKWKFLRGLGLVLVSVGIMIGISSVMLYYDWPVENPNLSPMVWISQLLVFLAVTNTGVFFIIKSSKRYLQHKSSSYEEK